MAVNISGLRRNIKNVAHNYTDAQVKVREATSNDPWGPSSTMMSEIADLTYNVVAFSEIMQMVWKRLNDHGKNWRHVYKSLVLLEYLIKTGSEKVAQQCKENIFAIQTLKDFQYLDDNKDQGINVREKAKALVALLKDDERLRNERVRALKAKERFAQSAAGIGSDTVYTHGRERFEAQQMRQQQQQEYDPANPEIEAARPQTAGEEELQLQLALAMSREEAEQEEGKNKSDEMRLQLALQKSKEAKKDNSKPTSDDLLDLDFGNPIVENIFPSQPPPPQRTAASTLDPWGMPIQSQGGEPHSPNNGASVAAAASPAAQNDPWGAPQQPAAAAAAAPSALNNDPWSPVGAGPSTSPLPSAFPPAPAAATAAKMSTSPNMFAGGAAMGAGPNIPSDADPWTAVKEPQAAPASVDPSDPFSPQAQSQLQEFDMFRSEIEPTSSVGLEPALASGNGDSNKGTTSPNPFDMNELGGNLTGNGTSGGSTGTKPKIVQSLLGEHSNLVNLDNLVSAKDTSARNPFESNPNPFQAKTQKPPLNQLMQKNTANAGWNNNQPSATNVANDPEFNPFF